MTMVQEVSDAADRVMVALVAGLELEFGRGAAEGLAAQFVASEACDFTWDARQQERWLGAYEAFEDSEVELDRVAIFGCLDGDWFVAVCIVDGDGMAHGMIGRRLFGDVGMARGAFAGQR